MSVAERFVKHWRLIVACCALSSLGSAACGGGAQLRAGVVYDYPVYYLDGPPPRYERYPSTYYRGRPAYLVDNRWYYSSPRGWVVFRDEPRELRSYRERRYVDRSRDGDRYRTPTPQRRAEPTERRRYRSRDDGPTERRRRSVDD